MGALNIVDRLEGNGLDAIHTGDRLRFEQACKSLAIMTDPTFTRGATAEAAGYALDRICEAANEAEFDD